MSGARPSLFAPVEGAPPGATRWRPTDHARGPWDPRHCHGGPVSALLARAVEGIADDDVEWQIARLTIELTRPVPVGSTLDLHTAVDRPGRKVSLVAATLLDGDTAVARVRALRVRRTRIELPPHPVVPPELTTDPGAGAYETPSWVVDDGAGQLAFHRDGAEHRVVEGGIAEPGPVTLWVRLLADVVPGESPTGVQRAAAAADFGNGVSGALDPARFLYINPDLTVHLSRPPEGEWIGMVSNSIYGIGDESSGAGLAESALYDERGRLGRSVQSLLVEAV